MKLRSIVPMRWVTDVASGVRFYCEHLGFTETSMFTGSLYFQCDEVGELWNSLEDKVTVVYPIEDFEYGMREFAICDNNGYLLQFGMKLDS